MNDPTYYSISFRELAMIRPSDLPYAVGVLFGPGVDGLSAGIAIPNGPWIDHVLGGAEVTWQIIIGKDEVPGWFALRNGAFYLVDPGQGSRP